MEEYLIMLKAIGAGCCIYSLERITREWRLKREAKRLIKRIWENISLCNGLGEYDKEKDKIYCYLPISKIEFKSYGFDLYITLTPGLAFEKVEKIKPVIEDSFRSNIELTHEKEKGLIIINVYKKAFEELQYKPIETKPNELYVGYNHKGHIKVDMHSQPHICITGATGTGKNCAAEIIISTLIANHTAKEVNLYFTQLMKKELIYFKFYEQVKGMAFNLNDAMAMFKEIDNLIEYRTNLIFKYADKGVKNIKAYNEMFKQNKLPYVYLVIDEYAFYMQDKADTKEEKYQKAYCLSVIKKILLDGRALGIYAIILLQRPDSESITGTFKAQVTNILCFWQANAVSSRIALENDDATRLKDREAILKNKGYQVIKTPFISDKIIKECLKHREVKQQVKAKFEVKEIKKETSKQDNVINFDDGIVRKVK